MSSTPVDDLLAVAAHSSPKAEKTEGSKRVLFERQQVISGFVVRDWLALVLGAFLVSALASAANNGFDSSHLLSAALAFWSGRFSLFVVIYATCIIATANRGGLYRAVPLASIVDEGVVVAKSTLLGVLVLFALLYVYGVTRVPLTTIAATSAVSALSLLATRQFRSSALVKRFAAGRGLRNVLILGTSAIAKRLARHLSNEKRLGYVVKGFLDHHRNGDSRVIGTFEELPTILRSHFIDEVFVTLQTDRGLIKRLAMEAAAYRVDVKVIPDVFDDLEWHAPVEYAGGFPVIALHRERKPQFQLFLKRAIDLIASTFGIVVLSPVLLLVAVLIRLDSPGPTFYRSRRVGQKGRIFRCWKFRTMVSNAEELLDSLMHLNERQQILFKISNDPRLTRMGKFLRRYSLDELPQLFNVFAGDMSLVGPRPPTVREYEQYQLEHLRRLEVVPGMTGLWQVSARTDPSFETYVRYDLEYIEDWSLWLDLKILAKTVPTVLAGTGS